MFVSTIHITEKDGLAIVKISPESGVAGKKGVMIVLVSGLESKLDKKDGKWTAKNGDKLGKYGQSHIHHYTASLTVVLTWQQESPKFHLKVETF